MNPGRAATIRPSPTRLAPDPIDPLQGSPFETHRANYIAIRRILTGVLVEHGLLLTEYHALKTACLGPSAPTTISQELGLTPAATTDVIDRLESRGLVRREPNPQDRRSTFVVGTPAGHEALREARLAYRQVLDHLAAEMSPRGLAALELGCKELMAILERYPSPANVRRAEARGRV